MRTMTPPNMLSEIAPASTVRRKPRVLASSQLSVPATPVKGNVLAAMGDSAAKLASIPANTRSQRTKKLPKPPRVGPSAMQKVGKVLGEVGKESLNVIERALEGFD